MARYFKPLSVLALFALSSIATIKWVPVAQGSEPIALQTPAPLVQILAVPPAAPAKIGLDLSIPLDVLRRQVEAAVPSEWAEWAEWVHVDQGCYKYRVRRDPIAMSVGPSTRMDVDWRINAEARGHFAVEGCVSANNHACWPCAGCDADIGLPASADVSVDPDWHLKVNLRNLGLNVGDCKPILNFNINGRVADRVNPRIDEAMAHASAAAATASNFKAQGQMLWDLVSTPIRLADDVWLTVNPKSVGIARLPSATQSFDARIVLFAWPAVSVGQEPAARTTPLPAIQRTEASPRFTLPMDAELDFVALSRMLGGALIGHKYRVADKTLSVAKTSVYGSGEGLIARVDVEGDARGAIYYWGIPAYDISSSSLSAPGDFDYETRTYLEGVAPWILETTLAFDINHALVAKVGPDLAVIRGALGEALNKSYGSVELDARLDDIPPSNIYVKKNAFLVRTILTGVVKATVH